MTRRTYRALLIANSTFPEDAFNLQELEGPRNDPVVLRDALCDATAGLFPADNVRLVTERTMAEVLREVEDFLRSATNQDTLLLYYSGHGMLDQSSELFFCTRDSRVERLRSTAVKASDLRAMMDESAAAALVVMLDCCHSGRFKGGAGGGGPGDVSSALSGRGRFVLTSSRPAELAHDAHTRNHASLFTHHLAEGLRHGAPDLDGDGLVNLSELYDYVHAALRGEGRPEPQKRFAGSGDVAVALRPVRPEQRPEQPELVDPALADPVLDLPETAIDLGEIAADEVLPPERIAVINRGGGTLDWTVESSAPWLRAEVEEGAAVLYLSPEPGPNRANVYVTDTRTGTIRTVRVSVRVRATTPTSAPEVRPPPRTTPPAPKPEILERPAPRQQEPESQQEPEPEPQRKLTWPGLPGWLQWPGPGGPVPSSLRPAIACIVAGLATWIAVPLAGVDDLVDRDETYGAGFGVSLLAGVALMAFGLLALLPRWRMALPAAGLGLLAPLLLLRLGEIDAYSGAGNTFLLGCSALLGAGAGVVIVRSLRDAGLLAPAGWAPEPLVVWTMVAAGLWIVTLFVDPYQRDGQGGHSYGGLFDSSRTGEGTAGVLRLCAALAVAGAAYAGLRRLAPTVGRNVVVGAALVPLLAVAHEILYLSLADEGPDSAGRLGFQVVGALALGLCGVAAVVPSRRDPTEVEADAEAERLGVRSVSRTLAATLRWVRRRPLAALWRAAVAAAVIAATFILLGLGPKDEQIFTFDETGAVVTAGAFSPDGDLVAIPTSFGAELRDTSTFAVERTIGENWVELAAFSPNGDVVATQGSDGVVLWNARTGDLQSRLAQADDAEDDYVTGLAFSPDSKQLVVVYGERLDAYYVEDPGTVGSPSTYDAAEGQRLSVAFSPDGKRIAVAGFVETGEIEILDAGSLDVQRTLTDTVYSRPSSMSFSPDSELLAADNYSTVEVWDPARSSGTSGVAGIDVDSYVGALAWSPVDDNLLAVGDGDDIELWNISTGQRIETLTGHDDDVDSLAFSADGRFIASSAYDSIRLWRTP